MSVQKQIDRLIVHRASEWLEVLRTQRTEEYGAFVKWITESPRHMDEFLKVLALAREARQALPHAGIDVEALLARTSLRVTPLRLPLTTSVAPGRRWQIGLLAGAAALVALTVGLVTVRFFTLPQRFETLAGEQRTVRLKDGSIIYLNARSAVEVRLRPSRRDVKLLEGDAVFAVAHDKARPFIVLTNSAAVRAVGTEFDVSLRDDETRVAVIKGKVQVSAPRRLPEHLDADKWSPPSSNASDETDLVAGQTLRVSAAGAVERRPANEMAQTLAWRQGRLVFRSTPLEVAIREFNRYHRTIQLRLEGVPPRSHHYSGQFNASDIQSFVDILARERDLIVEKRGNEVVIRLRPAHLETSAKEVSDRT